MNQREAVDTLFQLLPRMEKETPEKVFTKYAAEKRLAPAQLSKLGHVFNTASTNVTLKKDRNGRPTLIDVPAMVSDYVETTGRSSKKAHESFLSDGSAPLLEKAASVEEPYQFSRGNVPDVWNGGKAYLENQKVASAPKPLDYRSAGRDAITLVDRALEEYADKMADFHGEVSKIAKALSSDKEKTLEKVATYVTDLGGLTSEAETAIIVDSLNKRFKSAGINLPLEDGGKRITSQVVLHRDRTGQMPAARNAIEHVKAALAAHGSILDGMSFLKEHEAEIRKDPALDRRLDKLARQVDNQGTVLGLFKGASTAKKDPAEDAYDSQMRDANEDLDSAVEGPDGRELRYGDAAGSAARIAALGGGKLLHKGIRLAVSDIPGYIKEFTQQGTLGQTLEPTARENAARSQGHALNREQIAKDTRAAALLQKLMISDEVLSTKDPELVFNAFQSIRASTPHIATDETVLKLLLRQATEIGGLDIDTGGAIRKFDDPKVRPGSKSYDRVSANLA